MKCIYFFTILLFLVTHSASAQERQKEKEAIMAEATLLYNSERASWMGTDLFMAKFPDKRTVIGGYLSYSAKNKHICIFYNRLERPGVIATFSFDNGFTPAATSIDTVYRSFTTVEKEYFELREIAKKQVANDTLFKYYKNTSFNYVPLITNGNKRVYVFTGTNEQGKVLFGNDYCLEFDKKNRLKSKKALHKSLIVTAYGDNKKAVAAMHSHVSNKDELITATDVCTLLLYGPYTGWENYYVISDKYVSIWELNKEQLVIITRAAWDKMISDKN